MIKATRKYFAHRPERLAYALLLAGLLLRAIIPVGYMFNYGSITHDGPLIVLCPEGIENVIEGTVLEDLVATHAHHVMNGDETGVERAPSSAPCIFMSVAALFVLFAVFLLLSSVQAIRRRWLRPHEVFIKNSAALGYISPRAPPLHA